MWSYRSSQAEDKASTSSDSVDKKRKTKKHKKHKKSHESSESKASKLFPSGPKPYSEMLYELESSMDDRFSKRKF